MSSYKLVPYLIADVGSDTLRRMANQEKNNAAHGETVVIVLSFLMSLKIL